MKKLLLTMSLMFGCTLIPAYAVTTPVQNLEDISLDNPPEFANIKILSNVQPDGETMLYADYVVLGKIEKNQDGTINFIPLEYKNFHNDVYKVDDKFTAKFIEIPEKAKKSGVIEKETTMTFDFIAKEVPQVEESNVNIVRPAGGLSRKVNMTGPVLLNDTIPQTMKEFPGIKLDSFDNGSNFNLEEPVIYSDKKDSNINGLKQ